MLPVAFQDLLAKIFENLADEVDFCEDTLGIDPEDFEGVECTTFRECEMKGFPEKLKKKVGLLVEFEGKTLALIIQKAEDLVDVELEENDE